MTLKELDQVTIIALKEGNIETYNYGYVL